MKKSTARRALLKGTSRWTDSTPDDKLRFVRAIVERWRPRLNLHGWGLHVQLQPSPNGEEPAQCCAEIRADERYMTAVLDVFPGIWEAHFSDEEREHTILHELAHALTEGYKRLLERARSGEFVAPGELRSVNEFVTSNLASILWAAYVGAPPNTSDAS